MQRTYTFTVNGFPTQAVYDDRTVESVFLPLLREWTALYRREQRRILIFLSAPPGTGKTTLCRFLEYLSETQPGTEPLQAIGLDGFHYPQQYIRTHTVTVDGKSVPMQTVKGSPETFDRLKLCEKLAALRTGDPLWPVYDRTLHDVVEDVVPVTRGIVLLEGNWLLSSEPGWADLLPLCDDSVFITTESTSLQERLIRRKMTGGLSRAEAEAFYRSSDRKNIERLLQHHHAAHTQLHMTPDGDYIPAYACRKTDVKLRED